MIHLVIVGSDGRMGRALLACAPHYSEIKVVGQIARGDDSAAVIACGDAVIDFSSHEATAAIVELCSQQQKALVIGTTGHDDSQRASIKRHVSRIPIVLAPNFSTGVNTLFWLTRKAAEILGSDYDLEVVEMHHRLKKDAPSGTARKLGDILREVRNKQIDIGEHAHCRYGREGMSQRTPYEIGVHSVRGGDIVGDHTVIFASDGDRVELTHKASSRETFANGALRAALWVVKQKPGLYDMQDVLGLK